MRICIPFLCEVAGHFYTAGAVAATDAALVILQLGAYDSITAGAHALPFHAH